MSALADVKIALQYAQDAGVMVGGECAKECPAYGRAQRESLAKICTCGYQKILATVQYLQLARIELTK